MKERKKKIYKKKKTANDNIKKKVTEKTNLKKKKRIFKLLKKIKSGIFTCEKKKKKRVAFIEYFFHMNFCDNASFVHTPIQSAN